MNHKQQLLGHKDKIEGKLHPIVNAATKVWIQRRDLPILLVMNYATLLDDPDETESLAVSFKKIKHGSTVDTTPRNLGSDGGLCVDEEYLPFWWDNENIYYNIKKPTEDDIEELETFELNSPTPNDVWETSTTHIIERKYCHQTYPYRNGRKDLLCYWKILYNKLSTLPPIST